LHPFNLVADGDDLSDELVTEDDWRLCELWPVRPLRGVGAADCGSADLHEDFVSTGLGWVGDSFDPKIVNAVIDSGPHGPVAI
jgi:hypothetical protein